MSHRVPRTIRNAVAVVSIAACAAACGGDIEPFRGRPAYPAVIAGDDADTHYGERIADPFRALELDDAATRGWVDAQQQLTRELTESHPSIDAMRGRLLELQSIDSPGAPSHAAGRFFIRIMSAGSGGRGGLYVLENVAAEPRLLVDPDELWPDGSRRFSGYAVAPDGAHLAYSVVEEGTRTSELRMLTLPGGDPTAEVLRGVVPGSVGWTPDGAGFFYVGYEPGSADEAQLRNQRVAYHVVDTPQSRDVTVFARPGSPDWTFAATVTADGGRLAVAASDPASQNNTRLFVANVEDALRRRARPRELTRTADAVHRVIGGRGRRLWVHTTRDAPRGRIVEIDLSLPDGAWKTLVSASADTIGGVLFVGERLLGVVIEEARQVARIWRLDGTHVADAQLPALGGVGVFGTPGDAVAFVRVNGFNDPGSIFTVDLDTGALTPFRRPTMPFDPDGYVTRQVFYESRDGTSIPMYVAHRADLVPADATGVWMYGYGAWGWAAFPWYQPHVQLWLERGGVYALPNIRGGGEYGREWHEAGIRLNKQNSIDDFHAAARWLEKHGWARARGVIATGGSASGLLAGAAIVQEPELYGAAVIDFPAMDLIRAEGYVGGTQRVPEYGTVADEAEFRELRRLSPYHTIDAAICYPPVLVTTAERDVTIVPAHGYKFVAALQAAQRCDAPALLWEVPDAGHYVYGNTPEERAETFARQIAFAERALAR